MKKNKMMRLASVLMVLTLLSTSVIGGTFAKYVTTAESSDTARVAKWGITMNSNGSDTFVNAYDGSVVAVDGKDVVAPGTAKSVVYAISGAPETKYEITFDGTAQREVFLGEGTYTYTGNGVTYVDMDKAFAAGGEYRPLKYSLKIETTNGTPDGFTAGTVYGYDTLAAAMSALDNCKVTFEANVGCDVVVTFGWSWAYQGQDDVSDTVLGDIAANNQNLTVSDGALYDLNVQYTIKMTATQVD